MDNLHSVTGPISDKGAKEKMRNYALVAREFGISPEALSNAAGWYNMESANAALETGVAPATDKHAMILENKLWWLGNNVFTFINHPTMLLRQLIHSLVSDGLSLKSIAKYAGFDEKKIEHTIWQESLVLINDYSELLSQEELYKVLSIVSLLFMIFNIKDFAL